MTTFQDYKAYALADASSRGLPTPSLIEIVQQWMQWKRIQK